LRPLNGFAQNIATLAIMENESRKMTSKVAELSEVLKGTGMMANLTSLRPRDFETDASLP
jgi:hypothetical protein